MTVTGVSVTLTVNHILSNETISPGREVSMVLSDYSLSKNIQNFYHSNLSNFHNNQNCKTQNLIFQNLIIIQSFKFNIRKERKIR